MTMGARKIAKATRARVLGLERQVASMRQAVDELHVRVNALAGVPPGPALESQAAPPEAAFGPEVAPESGPEPGPEFQPEFDPELERVLEAEHGFSPEPGPAVAAPAEPAVAMPTESTPVPKPVAPAAPPAMPARGGNPATVWGGALRRWLFTGNLVAKLGLVILLIGVGFLLKYVAGHVDIPIELRIAAIAAVDIALLRWGWRIRVKRRGIGLPVQGAAIGILMLLTFGAFRLYGLMPAGVTFALLFVLTAFTCLLAVLQNAVWLALFGIAGGFMAPVLTSTGSGSHVALFSYYALLNAGILVIALRRAWRVLNLVGFAFTFGVGTAWAARSYVAGHYLSVQLFLLLFVLFYTGISLAYALRRHERRRPYIDGTLVFGTPLVGATLQYLLVRDMPFGAALSSLGGGIYYTALALALWRRRGEHFRQLVESWLAMGVLLGTIVVPLALDGRWTSAAWAAEGAAIVWIGLRHGRAATWTFGLAVQVGAWAAFLGTFDALSPPARQHAQLWLGFLLLAASAGIVAWRFQEAHARLPGRGFDTASMLCQWLAVGTVLAAMWVEIDVRTFGTLRLDLLAATAMLLAVLVAVVGRRIGMVTTRPMGTAIQLFAGAIVFVQMVGNWQWGADAAAPQPAVAVVLITAAALFSAWRLQRDDSPIALSSSNLMLAWGAVWWFGELLNVGAVMLADVTGGRDAGLMPWSRNWPAYGICVAASSLLACWCARRLVWPQLRWLGVATWVQLALVLPEMLVLLYQGQLPAPVEWGALAAMLATGEYLLMRWNEEGSHDQGWRLPAPAHLAIHLLRCAGPWLMIWPAGYALVLRWLAGPDQYQALLLQAGWEAGTLWAQCLPLWLQMGVIAWLLGAVRRDGWPVAPFRVWYAKALLPLGTAWCVWRVVLWNLFQDGGMTPLPYLPLLNPVDLASAFAAALVVAHAGSGGAMAMTAHWQARLRWLGGLGVFAWLNLMLLRTASHVLDLPYEAQVLLASRTVQAMLSLTWALSALVLMCFAAARLRRGPWLAGAAMLGAVVAKLFLVDLDGSGSMERIVSFLGVGLLMLAIGYLAPFPTDQPARARLPGEAA
nr:DUF2339 domain-containing protein [Pseudoduganella buxea]